MSPREKLTPKKTPRTRIEDISPFGEELSEERLRLASGAGGTLQPTFHIYNGRAMHDIQPPLVSLPEAECQ